ncbi:MAG: TIGR03749 family integrating conjugative element protein [Gammaproteobacteria bacterium]|nr:TIGR03749 family integrating conjugative element protein [Gammaproteobacteria bacterium]
MSALLAVILLLQAAGVNAAPDAPERIAWRKTPIAVELAVGAERLVHFPQGVKVGVPPQIQGALRVQSIDGTLYLLANQPFAATRVIVRGLDNGPIYLLDLSAETEGGGNSPIEIYLPDEEPANGSASTKASVPPQYGYVTLTRFAAQQMYAPARLLRDLPGLNRVPVKREPVALVRGGAVEALPLIAWRAGDLHVTAATLTNKTHQPQILDPRALRGHWLTATFQHNRLHEAGSEADRTVVYLISDRPFAASLR